MMSRQPFFALGDLHVVGRHPQKPIANLDTLFMVSLVCEFGRTPHQVRGIRHGSPPWVRDLRWNVSSKTRIRLSPHKLGPGAAFTACPSCLSPPATSER